MDTIKLLDNVDAPLCVFSNEGKLVFKNKCFFSTFPEFKTIEKFKKCFNFNLCFLSMENIKNKTPIDFLIQSKENFHTVCTYQNKNEEYIYYYIYTFQFNDLKIAVFKDITVNENIGIIKNNYENLRKSYKEIKETTEKFEKLKEHAQSQVLKMGIINRISLVIRETNDMETILASALNEIHSLLGSFKTYFADKEKNYFKIHYAIPNNKENENNVIEYEEAIAESIKNKNIIVNTCLKECKNSLEIMKRGVKRVIIPVYYKNKLLGIIVTLTKQKFNETENREILQSISVQLASAIIQADLIQELNKKNKKLAKTLTELKNTQMQLINTEKMASIGQLVAGVAHEINTPLASITSNNDMINKIINSPKEIKNNEILQELNLINIEAAKRITDIVKSLKRFVRLDEAQLQEANINNELDLTLKLTNHEIKKNTKIIKNYGELPPVKCYANMLNQVFMNLIVNASHSISKDNKEGIIEITTFANDKNLTVKIKDNGCGIKQENKSKVFTAGFTTKKANLGTGLGLSIAKKIIEMHKGNISFNSKENEGSEFIVEIPVGLCYNNSCN